MNYVPSGIDIPGSMVGPRDGSLGRVKVPTVMFGPRDQLRAPLDGSGLPRGERTRNQKPSNTSVVAEYVVNNETAQYLIEGQLFYIKRRLANMKVGRDSVASYSLVSIGELNVMLWNSWQWVRSQEKQGSKEAKRFLTLLALFNEEQIVTAYMRNEYPNHGQAISYGYDATTDNNTATDVQDPRLGELLALFKKDERYMHCTAPQLILDLFNFGGVTRNPSNSITLDSYASLGSTTHSLVMNTTSSHLCEVHDVFTPKCEMGIGSKLFLHMHRRPPLGGDAKERPNFTAFVIEPLCCWSTTRPSIAHCYRDPSNVLQNGLLVEIGSVIQYKSHEDSQVNQQFASGVTPSMDLEQIKRATARLGKITIALNKLK
jgi:hypothetical protein